MSRKLTAIFLLSLLIAAFLAISAFGAEKPLKHFKDRPKVPARYAPTYGFPGMTGF